MSYEFYTVYSEYQFLAKHDSNADEKWYILAENS